MCACNIQFVQMTGVYSANTVSPTVDCGQPALPGMEHVQLSNYSAGSSFVFACASGTPSGSSSNSNGTSATEVTCLENGLWDYGSLTCPGKKQLRHYSNSLSAKVKVQV